MSWTLGELAARCGGALSGDPDVCVEGVSTDSRSLEPGALFVAIRGPNFDGHAFLEQAIGRGAAGLLVSRNGAPTGRTPCIRVDDTIQALGALASEERQRFAGPVVAITGSNGKTTTKEMCASVLAAAGLRVRRSPGNLNNHIGLPISILGLEPEDQALVVELGMNHPGEIDELARIASPDVGAITLVAAAHLGPVGSLEQIARAKGELFDRIRPGGVAVLNADDPQIVAQSPRFAGAQLRFALESDADYRATDLRPQGGAIQFRLETPAGPIEVRLPVPGRHLVADAVCAAACAAATGRLPADPRRPLRAGLEAFRGVPSRLQVRELPRGITLIDDTYNSNPSSTAAALRTLREVAGTRRAIAVLGDMFELGDEAPELHAEVGRSAVRLGTDVLLAVGALSARAAAAARDAGLGEVHEAPDAEGAGAMLGQIAREADVVLVKGSRGMQMERAIRRFEEGSG